jgi:hypothetical protein
MPRSTILFSSYGAVSESQHDLAYYHKPEEAKVITDFIQSFVGDLDSVKTPHSRNKLARKGALLDARVGSGVQNIRALTRILNIRVDNISCALERRDSLSTTSSSRFDLLMVFRNILVMRRWHGGSYTQELGQIRRKW